MANTEQRIADILELSKLISETLIEQEQNVLKVDTGVNNLGVEAIKLSTLAEELKMTLFQHAESIRNVETGQDTITLKNQEILANLVKVLEKQDVTEASQNSIAEAIVDLSTAGNAATEDLKTKISENQTSYDENVARLLDNFDTVADGLLRIDYDARFDQLNERHSEIFSRLGELNNKVDGYNREIERRFEESLSKLATTIELIQSIDNQNESIKDDFKAIIARVGVIETKLSANL